MAKTAAFYYKLTLNFAKNLIEHSVGGSIGGLLSGIRP